MSQTPTAHHVPSSESLARGHEPDGLRMRTLVWLVVGFIAFAVAVQIGIWFVLKHYTHGPRAADRARSVARVEAGPPADAPPLQPTPGHDRAPWQDVAAMRASEDQVFAQMGWTVKGGHARIPDAVVHAVSSGSTTAPASRPTTGPGGAK